MYDLQEKIRNHENKFKLKTLGLEYFYFYGGNNYEKKLEMSPSKLY